MTRKEVNERIIVLTYVNGRHPMNPQEHGDKMKAMMLPSKILGGLLKTIVHGVYVHCKMTCE